LTGIAVEDRGDLAVRLQKAVDDRADSTSTLAPVISPER
jgi:hypothetical protein